MAQPFGGLGDDDLDALIEQKLNSEFASSYQPPTNLKIHLNCRDLSTVLNVGEGEQTFKWLATVARMLYAEHHEQFEAEQFVPVRVVDAQDNPLFPFQKIADRCDDGAKVTVELLGPRLGANDPNYARDKTLWELYAFGPAGEYVSTTILFDASDFKAEIAASEDGVPGVFGNFNGWGVPIPMKQWRGDVYRFQIEFPAGAQIVFKFAIGSKHVVSPSYHIVQDVHRMHFNYMYVAAKDDNYAALRQAAANRAAAAQNAASGEEVAGMEHTVVREQVDPTVAKNEEASGAPIRTLPARILGSFQGVRRMTKSMLRKQFARDWKQVQLADVIRSTERRAAVKEHMWQAHDKLRRIFRFYSSLGGQDIAYMNVLKFMHFCRVCGIPDKKRMTVTRIDLIFKRVNIEETYNEELIKHFPESHRNAMILKDDPFNPDNQFVRGEWYEALMRIALIKYPGVSAHEAWDKLLEEHVYPNSLSQNVDDIRDQLLDPDVQRIYKVYQNRLYDMFNHYAAADKSDLRAGRQTTINPNEFEMMLHDARLIDGRLSRREALSAFAMSQEDDSEDGEDGLYEMVYAEFLEVLGRLAVVRARNSNGNVDSPDPLAHQLEHLFLRLFGNDFSIRRSSRAVQSVGGGGDGGDAGEESKEDAGEGDGAGDEGKDEDAAAAGGAGTDE